MFRGRAILAIAMALTGCQRPLVLSTFGSYQGAGGDDRHERHTGVDFHGPEGSPALAAAPGIVERTGYVDFAGRDVVIRHADGHRTYYLHLDRVTVAAGQVVARGQVIGTIGTFTLSGGVPHVHLELWNGGSELLEDPLAMSAGCARGGVDAGSRLVLTHPVPCCDSALTPRPLDVRSPLAQAYLFANGAAGTRWIGGGSIGALTGPRLGDFDWSLAWDARAGVDDAGDRTYQARALLGPVLRRRPLALGALVGGGHSDMPGQAASTAELSVALLVQIEGPSLRSQMWARSSWRLDDPPDAERADNVLFGGDDLAIGWLIRVPPLSRAGVAVGLEYSEVGPRQALAVLLGSTLDVLHR